jgi:hypothetical protein
MAGFFLIAWVKHVLVRPAGRVKRNSLGKECDMGHSGRWRLGAKFSAVPRRGSLAGLSIATAIVALTGCPEDGIRGDDGLPGPADAAPIDGVPQADADPNRPCDMTGAWIAELHTVSNSQLGGDQNTTNWFYFEFTQDGERFTATKTLHCGFLVQGSVTVRLSDATLGALASQEFAGPGRQGTFKVGAAADTCDFSFDRQYNIRGANKARFLTDLWTVGSPAKPLTEFPALPTTTEAGMEDWESDGKPAISLNVTGLISGTRLVAQRDWNEHIGTVPQFSNDWGANDGRLTVRWDSQEAVSPETTPNILEQTATPKGDGWSRFARAEGRLTLGATDTATCLAVQVLADQIW